MKYFLLILGLILFQTELAADTKQLYTSKSYPYSNLINQTDEVKIYFTEEQSSVTCRVQVTKASKQWQSTKVTVQSARFQQAPLASCLQRDKAKMILKQSRQ